MENFLQEWTWLALGLVMIVEYLIGASKLKSNSTVELVLNIVKFIFGLDKDEEKKLN
jgi:hypothetical protein